MGLLSFLADLRLARLADELTQRLARQTYGLLREACQTHIQNMTHAEARGYVWAKARPIVMAEAVAAAIEHPALDQTRLASLGERARQRVVRAVLSDLMRDRVRHVNRRRAA